MVGVLSTERRWLNLPDMGSHKIGPWLLEYASAVPKDQAIVEVGAWLGAGTQYLIRDEGLLYVYDRFVANSSEVEKAAKFGVKLTQGQDTLPWVRSHLPEGINFVRCNLMESSYYGPQIGLYVDDASKSKKLWMHSMKTFEPNFSSGCIIILMDYWFKPCEVQRRYARKWQMIVENIHGTSCAVFRL